MSTSILDCRSHLPIGITPSAAPAQPLQRPSFIIPSTLLPYLDIASSHLRAARTVAFPTETVYGLGASSLNPEAVRRIYTIKNRPSDNPLIIHVSSLDMLGRLLPKDYTLSRLYLALITEFWPGPLTLLFPSPDPPPPPLPQTNAIRMPNHPLALALIHHSDLPLSAPSANSSGRPSPTCAGHVYHDLNGADGLGCILDGGECGVGVESTVVNGLDWREGGGGHVNVLRPGGLGVEEIERAVRQVDGDEGTSILLHGKVWRKTAELSSSQLPLKPDMDDRPPSTPGMKYRHYSPRIPVYLLLPSSSFTFNTTSVPPSEVLQALFSQLGTTEPARRPRLGLLHYEESPLSRLLLASAPDITPISLGRTATTAAHRLFAGMLQLEKPEPSVVGVPSDGQVSMHGVDAILIEGCTDDGLGLAVMERVRKAVGVDGDVRGQTSGQRVFNVPV